MQFKNREVQFTNRKWLVKVDENGVPIQGEPQILVTIEKAEGGVIREGTPINTENLNKGNWRDDDSISFEQRKDDILPGADATRTQIVTLSNGETWIVPPAKFIDSAKEICGINNNTTVMIGNVAAPTVEFDSNPQNQINAIRQIAESKTTVKVNSVPTDVVFTSDPQIQIHNKADLNLSNVDSNAVTNGKFIVHDYGSDEVMAWAKYYSDGTFEAHYNTNYVLAPNTGVAGNMILNLPRPVPKNIQGGQFNNIHVQVTRSSNEGTSNEGFWWHRGTVVSGANYTGVRLYSSVNTGFIVSVFGKWR
ncbi:MAG: hypothetical protein LBG88_02060 [Christensenellaceae bacterium]|jgi:hypothetical protein|nr:hypothetical protein [Christensenellaceae bacterium]